MSKARWLTSDQISRIRQLKAAGMFDRIIAARLGLDRSNVSRVLRRFGIKRSTRAAQPERRRAA